MTEPTVIEFAAPVRLLSLNDRGHWRGRHKLTRAWRVAAHWATVAQLGAPADRWRPPSLVEVRLPVARGARRDPHNYFATVKPIVDGLVDAGVWPDDTPEWVRTVEPSFVVCPPQRLLVTVTLTPLGEGSPL
jgi:hypothetical protein